MPQLPHRSVYALIALFTLSLNGCSGGGGVPSSDTAQGAVLGNASINSSGITQTPSPSPILKTAQPTALPIATEAASSTSAPTVGQLNETPVPADALADSIGVNTHLYEYGKDFSTIVSRVQSLGVRHLRDAIMNNNAPLAMAYSTLLSSANAKLDGYTDCTGIEYNPYSPTSPTQIQEFDSAIGNQLEAVEGPNEIDLRGDTNWVADTMACLPGLESAEPNLPFYAPSIGNQLSNATAFGNISNYIDFGNDHRYFNGHNPGSKGWGGTNACGVYGALPWAICETQINSATKPIVVTETGYSTPGEVDEVTQGKYLSRLFFVNLSAGILRTYVYVLKDYTGDGFGGDGLLHADDSPKPAYSALAAEIGLFRDSGSILSLSLPVDYSITTQTSSIKHILFKKSDGTYILALWNEVPSWNTSTSSEIPVSSQQITVNLFVPPLGVNVQSLDDSGRLVAEQATTSLNSISVSVDDHMTFVSFH